MQIDRLQLAAAVRRALAQFPVVVLTGPRQCGKTTLARTLVSPDASTYFDLEDPRARHRLQEPMAVLEPLRGLVVIDEIQRAPELFPALRVLADRAGTPARFLVLGSASGDLQRQSAESLAGRARYVRMGGFTLDEVGVAAERRLWLRGAFPRAFLAADDDAAAAWRDAFLDTIVERDLPAWGVRVAATALRRFWTMVAHYHGQLWQNADPARSLGVGEATVRRYLDLLTDALVVRQLPPWHANLRKRQVKSPKVYVRDSGLLHALLGLRDEQALLGHPKFGASWEGFVIEQILATVPHRDAAFWATHQGAELDLLLVRDDGLHGVECKWTDRPSVTRSMRIALEDLRLVRLAIVHPGPQRFPLADRIEAVPLRALAEPGGLFGGTA